MAYGLNQNRSRISEVKFLMDIIDSRNMKYWSEYSCRYKFHYKEDQNNLYHIIFRYGIVLMVLEVKEGKPF